MDTFNTPPVGTGDGRSVGPSPSPHGDVVRVDPEMVGMIRLRRREARQHQARLAQIRRHPDPAEGASGLAQQRAWALRHARQQRLQRSDLAMVRRSLGSF